MTGFGVRLADAKRQRGPLCVGIDPHPELLRAWDLPVTADGLAAFCDICVEAFAGFAVVKPQVAFFEPYGAAGFAVLERTIAALRSAGVLVLADAKRGDIGSTMAAYATAWAGDSPLAADAVTASPYLGFGSLRPLLEAAAAHDRGVFVLAATSNPEGATVQRAAFDGRTVAQPIVDQAAVVNKSASRRGPDPSAWSSAPRCSRRPTSARWADRCWCPAWGCRVDGPRRSAVWAGRIPASCCPRWPARCCAPGRRWPNCARPVSGCWTPSPIWERCRPLPAHRRQSDAIDVWAGRSPRSRWWP